MIDLLPYLYAGPQTLSVAEATAYVKQLLDDDATVADVWVRGEVSDPRTYASGHTYFTLRDAVSQLKCVLFRQRSRGLEPLQHGKQYVVRGSISLYEASGTLQLYVSDHRPIGTGELYQAFELLKARLDAEGLFAPERKRPLPRWPQRIGVATSKQGAVLHDVCVVIGRRYPLAELVLAPCQVQGAEAVRSIVAGIDALNAAGVDVIVVARGGGSIEDLWAYNEEPVARAIAGSRVPVVSAVGHETDFTIADFAADARAPTPSVAGELLVPDAATLAGLVDSLALRANRAVKAQCWVAGNDLADRAAALQRSLSQRLERQAARLAHAEARLAALSPLRVLGRGFTLVMDVETGKIVRSAAQLHPEQSVDILFADGRVKAKVERTL